MCEPVVSMVAALLAFGGAGLLSAPGAAAGTAQDERPQAAPLTRELEQRRAAQVEKRHEVCMENTRVHGLYVDPSNPFPPDENSVRQSLHPSERGHGAFASA